MKGTVKFFNGLKQFGFIAGEDNKDYFVHISGVDGDVKLEEGTKVSFETMEGDRGPKAVNVVYDND